MEPAASAELLMKPNNAELDSLIDLSTEDHIYYERKRTLWYTNALNAYVSECQRDIEDLRSIVDFYQRVLTEYNTLNALEIAQEKHLTALKNLHEDYPKKDFNGNMTPYQISTFEKTMFVLKIAVDGGSTDSALYRSVLDLVIQQVRCAIVEYGYKYARKAPEDGQCRNCPSKDPTCPCRRFVLPDFLDSPTAFTKPVSQRLPMKPLETKGTDNHTHHSNPKNKMLSPLLADFLANYEIKVDDLIKLSTEEHVQSEISRTTRFVHTLSKFESENDLDDLEDFEDLDIEDLRSIVDFYQRVLTEYNTLNALEIAQEKHLTALKNLHEDYPKKDFNGNMTPYQISTFEKTLLVLKTEVDGGSTDIASCHSVLDLMIQQVRCIVVHFFVLFGLRISSALCDQSHWGEDCDCRITPPEFKMCPTSNPMSRNHVWKRLLKKQLESKKGNVKLYALVTALSLMINFSGVSKAKQMS